MHSFPYLPVQSSSSDDTERDMDFPGQMTLVEIVGDDAEDGLDQDEDEDGQADLVMEIAVGTFERST